MNELHFDRMTNTTHDPARLARLVRHCKARMEDFGPGGPQVQSADQSTGRVTLRFPGRALDGVLSDRGRSRRLSARRRAL